MNPRPNRLPPDPLEDIRAEEMERARILLEGFTGTVATLSSRERLDIVALEISEDIGRYDRR